MKKEKSYLNKDLIQNKKDFENSITNDFIGDKFIENLEWAMMIIQHKFKQIRVGNHLKEINRHHFDKSFLIAPGLQGMNTNIGFYNMLSEMQATPEIFPYINIKMMVINDTISLQSIRHIALKEKMKLNTTKKYVYDISTAYYKKDTEAFYGIRQGYEVNPNFFKANEKLTPSKIPNPISLNPKYVLPKNSWKLLDNEIIVHTIKQITMAYQLAFSFYYEWCVYIKEYDNIGLIIPIDPCILSELYKKSMLKFDNKKSMLHFVKSHYRRKIAKPNEDYSIFVQKYLRGENKFKYNGFYAEIIPPKYDINRAKTRKKFINATE